MKNLKSHILVSLNWNIHILTPRELGVLMKPGVNVSWDDLSGTVLFMLGKDRSTVRCCNLIRINIIHKNWINTASLCPPTLSHKWGNPVPSVNMDVFQAWPGYLHLKTYTVLTHLRSMDSKHPLLLFFYIPTIISILFQHISMFTNLNASSVKVTTV